MSDGPPHSKPLPLAPQPAPAGVLPTDLDLNAGRYAQDSDKNGYADLIDVTVYLFCPSRFAGTLPTPGEFLFVLRSPAPENALLAEWRFSPEVAAQSLRRLMPGPGYVFKLSLRDVGSDELPAIDAVLTCRFTPSPTAAGEVASIESRSPIRISVGKTR